MNELNYEGKIFKTNNYGPLVVTKYVNSSKVHIKFIETGYETNAEMNQIKKGNVKDRLVATVWGVPDLLVGFRGKNLLLEVKDGGKVKSARKLTVDQVEWHQGWRGHVAVVESVEQAIKILGE